MGTAEQYAPMTDEQRARWTEELRALALVVPQHIQLSGWYAGKKEAQ